VADTGTRSASRLWSPDQARGWRRARSSPGAERRHRQGPERLATGPSMPWRPDGP